MAGKKQIDTQTIDRLRTTADQPRTLLWVGTRDDQEFRDIYQACEKRCAQLAWRSDLVHCAAQPASDVSHVLLTRQSRIAFPGELLQSICKSYPDASFLQVLGSLTAGERPRPSDDFAERSIYWHQANQFVDDWLPPVQSQASSPTIRSVAVIADTIQVAEPLMDLATSAGAATVWVRKPNPTLARNFDAFWWDDSAASPATKSVWRKRIDGIAQHSESSAVHAWITHSPNSDTIRQAHQAGVGVVLSKPYKIDALLQTISPAAASQAAGNPVGDNVQRFAA